MSQNFKQIVASTINFTVNPLIITADKPSGVNIIATGNGRSIGSSGTRLWDTNILPATSTTSITPGQIITLPFSNANLPNFYFDAIVEVFINGTSIPIAVSNSPDNIGEVSINTTLKKLFWMDLFCFRNGSFTDLGYPGNPNANNNYMFGGDSGTFWNQRSSSFNLVFAEIPTAATTINYTLDTFAYAAGQIATSGGQLTINTTNKRQSFPIDLIDANPISPSNNPSASGFSRIKLTPTDSSYQSILPYYHFGFNAGA